jgi:pimeloyl-ACP methyl ester carboxylesterase
MLSNPHRFFVVSFMGVLIAAAAFSFRPAAAQPQLVPADVSATLLGAERARGAVVWSHGCSLQEECSIVPTPAYITAFRAAGWDTFRLNHSSVGDTLPDGAAALANEAEGLKRNGYRRIVLAGQSFGAFISLMAAGRSDAVDAVIATAPAAYGSAESNPVGYGLNATRLYEVLGSVRRARVALFFFEGDIFDPGGRAAMADRILGARRLAHLVVDRPAGLSTHWAGIGTAFAEHFAPCLVAFAASDPASGTLDCRALAAARLRPNLPAPSRHDSLAARN